MLKPLHWEDADEGFCTKWKAAALGGQYELVWFEDKQGFSVNFSWGRPLSFWFIQGEPDEYGPTGPKSFTTLDQAKAAAQADYEARILSALEPTTFSPEAKLEETQKRMRFAAECLLTLGAYMKGETPYTVATLGRGEDTLSIRFREGRIGDENHQTDH
jgi:hypothetical protein